MDDKVNAILMKVFDICEEEVLLDIPREKIAKWDSLTHMDLVITIENEFSVRLEIDDIIAMTSLNAIRNVLIKNGVQLCQDRQPS